MTQFMLKVTSSSNEKDVFLLEVNKNYKIKSVATTTNNVELAKRLVQQRTMYQLQKYLTEYTNLKFKLLKL